MWLLGKWYQGGVNGLVIDAVQSRAWLERSAAARNPAGLATFGCCLLQGIGGPQDNALGLVSVTEAAGLGSEVGAFLLGQAFFGGLYGLSRDPARARYWLKKAFDGECTHKHLSDEVLANAARWLRALESSGE